MQVTRQSSLIASEPEISPVKVFHSNDSEPVFIGSEQEILDSDSDTSLSRGNSQTYCKCPHILVADDDAFQHFYYNSLFKSFFASRGSATESQESKDAKLENSVQVCYSGEEMLDIIANIIQCGCNKLNLVISDYSMGQDKLNGVQVCAAVRRSGYYGPVFLRTSEREEDLRTLHKDLEKLVREKVIYDILSKADTRACREALQKYVRVLG